MWRKICGLAAKFLRTRERTAGFVWRLPEITQEQYRWSLKNLVFGELLRCSHWHSLWASEFIVTGRKFVKETDKFKIVFLKSICPLFGIHIGSSPQQPWPGRHGLWSSCSHIVTKRRKRLENSFDNAFSNQDLCRSVTNPVIAAPNWRFDARSSA